MWKSKKFIVVAVLIAVVLVAGTTGIVLAQDNNDGAGPQQTLLARVAQIMGIDQQKLQDAFKQAISERRAQLKETFDQKLQSLVSEGKITQQQADDFNAWLKAKPDVPVVGPRQLQKLLDEGKITQEQVDAYKAWLQAKPQLPLPKNGEFGGQRPGPGFFGQSCPQGQQSGSSTSSTF
jgi:outer membrane murein-binding lipoprotein Lpp